MEIVVLSLVAFLASIISGVTGLGGGIILLATFGQVLSATALLPIHGFVQLVSNGSRIALGFKSLNWSIISKFLLGAVVGSSIGASIIINIPTKVLSLSVGIYLLISIWLPISKMTSDKLRLVYPIVGFISSLLSLFIGVSGPLIHPILAKDKSIKKESFIGTEAVCSGMMHFFKIIVFVKTGFEFKSHINLIVAVTTATVLGIYVGSKLLKKISENMFHLIIRVIVTVLALRMIIVNI